MKNRSLAAAALITPLLLAVPAAFAADDKPAFYVGAGLGFAAVAPRNNDLKDDSTVDGRASGSLLAGLKVATLPWGPGWPLYAELGYQDIARFEGVYKTSSGDARVATEGSSAYLAARLAWPITPNFELFGRLGVSRNDAESRTLSGPTLIDINGSKTAPLVGFGLEYRFDNGIGLRGDLTSYGKASKNSDAGALNFSVSYRF